MNGPVSPPAAVFRACQKAALTTRV